MVEGRKKRGEWREGRGKFERGDWRGYRGGREERRVGREE